MNCQYKDSLIPRCDIVSHPNHPNLEYCRVCRAWDDVRHIGNEFAVGNGFHNLLWFLLAVGLVLMVLQGMDKPLLPPEFDRDRPYSNDYHRRLYP